MEEFNPVKYAEELKAKALIESKYEWRKWTKEIPAINFPSDWAVQVIPPFGGAVARFRVRKDSKEVSVYLDCYDELGIVGKPYWEIYPDMDGSTSRFAMNDTIALVEAIGASLMDEYGEED